MNVTLDPRDEQRLASLTVQSGESPEALARRAMQEGLRRLEADLGSQREGTVGDPAYEPGTTPLGKKLRALRRKYVEAGGRLYTLDEINAEVAEGRGEP